MQPRREPPTRTGSSRMRVLVTWFAMGILLVAASGSAGAIILRDLYGPAHLPALYLSLLDRGDAAGALALPGVDVPGSPGAADGLLRGSTLSSVTAVRHVSTRDLGEGVMLVRMGAKVDGEQVEPEYRVARTEDGWRFAVSPLAELEIRSVGVAQLRINGFGVEKARLNADGAAFQSTQRALVFTPARYHIEADDPFATASATVAPAWQPGAVVRVRLEGAPTPEFRERIEEAVHEKLGLCATSTALFPADCPFGYAVVDRIAGEPSWSVPALPHIRVEAGPDAWRIAPVSSLALIDVPIRSLYDGIVRDRAFEVPFLLSGEIATAGAGVAITLRGEPLDSEGP